MERGLIVGRFQPYHLGHHKGILRALKHVDELVIVIGSPMRSFEVNKNPFTCGERIEMISGALKASRVLNRCYIIPVPDIQDNSLWVSRIESFCPKFNVIYTNNPLVEKLFHHSGYLSRKVVSRLKNIKSEHVRYWLRNNMEISSAVPKSVEDYLTKIGARNRLRCLSEEEEKQ